MTKRLRLAGIALAAVLATATMAPAQAQVDEDPTFHLRSSAVTLEIDVLGTQLGSFAGSSATAHHTPSVETEAFGLRTPAGELAVAKASATEAGQNTRDPEGEGLVCDTVAGLLPLDLPEGIGFADVCSTAYAALSSSVIPEGGSASEAGILTVNGKLLVDLIYDLVITPLLDGIEPVLEAIDGAVVGPVDAALAQICENIPQELNPVQVIDAAEEFGLPVGEVIANLPQGDQIAEELGNDCLLSLQTMVNLRGIIIQIVEEDLRALLNELLDRDLLNFSLGSSAVNVGTIDGVNAARAELQTVALQTPSLQFLLDAIEELVAVTVQGVIDDVTVIVPEQLDSAVEAIPALGDVLTPILDGLGATGLIDDEPLLTIAATSGVASAKAPVAGGTVDTSESASNAVILRISSAIANTLGIPNETVVAPGTSQVIAEGTPLETSITVGGLEEFSETVDGVETAGIRVAATELHLLKGIEGGIRIASGVASAQVGGTPGSTQITSLPTTGGNALILGAGVGLVALAAYLRRRSQLAA